MPIPSTGGNQSGASKKGSAGGSVVELVISAKNETNESFDKLQTSLEKAKKNTEVLSKKFEDLDDTSSDAFKSIRQNAEDLSREVLPKLRQGIDLTAKSFQSLITIADKSLSVFNGVFEALDNIYEVATSDVSSAFFGSLAAAANQAIAKVDALSNIINSLQTPSVNLAKGIGGASAIDGIFNKLQSIAPLLDSIDTSFSQTVKGIRDGSGYAAQGLNALTDGIGAISNIQAPVAIFSGLQETIGNTINVVSEVSQRVFFFMGALEQLKGVVLGGPFDLLIGQNVRLQEQLLGIQSTLAATTTLLRDTQEVGAGGQVTEKILSLAAPVNNVLAKIRQDSLELVGVTSNELVDVFDIVTQSLTDVNISLKEAGDLTISFAASLGTIGIPLYQARQEIQSILTGQIDQNSALAKSIGLTNAQLKSWIAQDKVYERLTERLAAFKEGNALAAQTIGGLTSNIREIADEIGRAAGAKFLSPIVAEVGEVYRFLLKNQAAITDAVTEFLDRFAAVFTKVRDGAVGLGTALAPLSKEIGRLFSDTIINVISGIGDGLKTLVAVAEPFLAILGQIAKVAVSTPLVSLYAQMKVLSGAFGIAARFAGNFATVLPVLGQGLGVLQVRNLPLVNSFSNLSAAFKGNIAAAVTLGASLTKIPGVMNMMSGAVQKNILGFGALVASGQKLANIPIAASIAKNGAVMQMLAAGTVAATPALLGFAKTGLALAKNFNIGQKEIAQFTAKLPQLISFLTASSSKIPVVGAKLSGLIGGLATKYQGEIAKVAESGGAVFETIDKQIQQATISAGAQVKKMIVTFGLWGASAFLVGSAINQLIIKNENLGLAITFLYDKLKEFAEFIGEALTNPLGILASAVIGVTIAIKTGLIAQLQSMAVATAKAISPQLIPALKVMATTLKGMDQIFIGFIGRLKEAVKGQDELAKAIAMQEKAQQSAGLITQKEADNLSSLNKQRKEAKKKFAESTDPVEKQKAAQAIADLDVEIEEKASRLRERRKGSFNQQKILEKDRQDLKELGQKRKKLTEDIAKETDPSRVLELSDELGGTDGRIRDKRKSLNRRRRVTLDQQGGLEAARVAVDQAKINAAKKAAESTGNIFEKASRSAKGLSSSVGTALTGAFASLTGAIQGAGIALKTLVAEFAPLIAIGAAIGVVVVGLTNWAASEERKNAGVKEYNERLKETITSLERIKKIRESTPGNEEEGLTPRNFKELQGYAQAGESGVRRVRELTTGRSLLGSIGEFASSLLPRPFGGGDIKKIQDEQKSAARTTEIIDEQLRQRLAIDPSAKDGTGLRSEVITAVRENQRLANEVSKLNKEGKDDEARLKQAELESSTRDLDDLEKTFADNKEALRKLDLSGQQAEERDKTVADLTAALNQLAGLREGTIAPMRPIEQGTATGLNLTQFNQAQLQYARGGQPEQLERYAALLMGSAENLVQEGQIDPTKAIDAIRELAESTVLDPKTVKAAQEQIIGLWEITTKRLLQEEDNRQSGLDLLRQKGLVSEKQYLEESLNIIEARLKKQTELSLEGQKQQIEIVKVQEREQIRLIREQAASQKGQILEQIRNEKDDLVRSDLEKDYYQTEAEATNQEVEIKEATEKQIQQLRLDYESEYTAMMIAAEKERQDARIKIVQEMQDKLNDQLTYSEEMRSQNLTRLVNEELIFEEEANIIRADSTDRRLAREIEAEKAIRDERMKTPALFESEIRKSDIKIAQLTQQRIENEGKAWDAQMAALKRNLKYRVDLFVNAIEEENKALLGQQKYIEAMQSTLDTRNQVLGTAKGIVDETADSIAGAYNAVGAGSLSQNNKDTLQSVAELAKLETLQKSVELEKQMFETQLAQNQLALQRQGIELQLKEIEEQRLVLEKKAALELARKAAEEKPGDRQAQLDYAQAQRELDLQMASFGLTRKEIEMNLKEQQLAQATYGIRVRNKERDLQTQIAEQQAVVAETGNPLIKTEVSRQSQITGLMSLGLSRGESERLARDPDALNRWARAAEKNGLANVFPQLQGMGFSFNDYTSNRGAQQTAIINTGARFGATSIPTTTEAGTGYDAVYGGQIPTNPTQTEVGSTFDEVNAIVDDINLLDETVKSLGEGAIPTMEDMIDSAATLIDEQFPAFKEALDEVNADKLPTTTSVLDELGVRLQSFTEEDLPGMQEALTGVQDTAVMGIDTIVLKLEEETTNLTNAIAAQFETVWQDILETIVLPPEAEILSPSDSRKQDQLDYEAREMAIEAKESSIEYLSRGKGKKKNEEKIKALEAEINQLEIQQQAALESGFMPTSPSQGTKSGRWNPLSWLGGGKTEVNKTFTTTINVNANTAADANKIGTEVASFMKEVLYKTGEVTA